MRTGMDGWRERIGTRVGELWSPAIEAISRARQARMFHPRGLTFAGRCVAIAPLGERLQGRVLARTSQALWKRPLEYLDVLGVALRFRAGAGPDLDAAAEPGDQDLLCATIVSPLTMPLSPFTTNAHDFLGNRYWAVAPFEVDGARVKFRLSPRGTHVQEGHRDERLRAAVRAGEAGFLLEARRTLHRRWQPIARITLEHEVHVDQARLAFDPYRDGAAIVPVGLVHAIRRAVYAAGQRARPR